MGGARWVEGGCQKCRNQGQDTEINLIQKLKHTLLYLIKNMVPLFLLLILTEGKRITELVNMETVAHVFLHKWEVVNWFVLCRRLYLLILWNMFGSE